MTFWRIFGGVLALFSVAVATAQEVVCRDRSSEFIARGQCPDGSTLVRSVEAKRGDYSAYNQQSGAVAANQNVVCRGRYSTFSARGQCPAGSTPVRGVAPAVDDLGADYDPSPAWGARKARKAARRAD